MTTPTIPLTGVVPPLLTPLTADGEIDLPSLERLVGRLLDAGVDGIFALGSSGEVAFWDDARREAVLEAVTGTVAGQVPVIAGVIDMQTDRVIQHVRAAERFDLAGYVVTAPFYAITGPEEINTHFRAVAAAIGRGVDVRGFYVNTLIDGFEWADGWSQRFGLVHVDPETLVRTPKRSWEWLRDVVAAQPKHV